MQARLLGRPRSRPEAGPIPLIRLEPPQVAVASLRQLHSPDMDMRTITEMADLLITIAFVAWVYYAVLRILWTGFCHTERKR